MKTWITITTIIVAFVATTGAQDVDRPHRVDDPAVLLARSCVSERGWAHETTDCAAIAQVVRVRMERRGETFVEAIRALAPRLHGAEWISTRPWLQDLDEDGHRPRWWRGAPWELRPGCDGRDRTGRCRVARRDDWLLTLEHARAILADEVPAPCVGVPLVWGARRDIRLRLARRARERAEQGLPPDGMRFAPLECGTMLNMAGCYVRHGERCPLVSDRSDTPR